MPQEKFVKIAALVWAAIALICFNGAVFAEQGSDEARDSYYVEPFEIPAFHGAAADFADDAGAIPEKATRAETEFIIAQATNTCTTGHGNVQFWVFFNHDTHQYNLLLWSKGNCWGATLGYRKWYRLNEGENIFGPWPYAGGAVGVGWPPKYDNMYETIQLHDIDQDGDLDVFLLLETARGVWTVYLFKNQEYNHYPPAQPCPYYDPTDPNCNNS